MRDPSDPITITENKRRDSGQNNEDEETQIRKRMNTYGTSVRPKNNRYEFVEEVKTFFSGEKSKFEKMLNEKNMFEDYMTINAEIRGLGERIKSSAEARAIFEKLNIKIIKIKEKTFNWSIDYANILYIKTLYDLLVPFDNCNHFMYIDISYVRENLLPLKYFLPFLEVPYHSEDEDHIISETISEFYTVLLSAFNKLYLLFPCGSFPRIDADQVSLLDPFMRQKIRRANYKRYNKTIGSEYRIKFADMISEVIEGFIFEGALKWTASNSDHVIVPILQLIYDTLSYGLILPEESVRLMENIYMISEVIVFVEESLKDSKETSMQRRKTSIKGDKNPVAVKVYQEFLQIRKLISKIVLQIILLYSDAAFVDTCFANKHKRDLNEKKILAGSIYKQDMVYKHICLTFLKYLSPRLSISNISNVELTLEKYNNHILLFLTNYRNNIFMDSLVYLNNQTINYYFEPLDKTIVSQVKIVKKEVREFLQLVKNSPTKIQFELLVTRFEEICNGILNSVKDDNDNKFKMELSRNGTLRFLVHTLEQLHVRKENRTFSFIAVNCITELMKDNYAGQSLLFRGSTHDSYLKFFENHKFRCMNMILEIFRNDYLLFDNSEQVFEVKIQMYDRLLASFHKYQLAKEDNDRFRLTIGTLRFFNSFFDDILMANLKNDNYLKKYDVIIQLKIVDIITTYVLPAISNSEFLKDFSVIDLNEVSNFTFTLENVKNHSEYFKSSSLRVMLYELYFTFLKLFVRATTFAFPKVVFDKIIKVIRETTFENFFFNFPSGPTLRMWYTKLCTRFIVFPNNQILYETPAKNQSINVHRDFVPRNHAEIRRFLEDEFKWLSTIDEQNPEPSEKQQDVMKDYLLRGSLPAVYKCLQGINLVITIIDERHLVEDIKNLTYSLLKMIKNRTDIINHYLHFKGIGKSVEPLKNSYVASINEFNEEGEERGSVAYGEKDSFIPPTRKMSRGDLNLLPTGKTNEAIASPEKLIDKINNYKRNDKGAKQASKREILQNNATRSRHSHVEIDSKTNTFNYEDSKNHWDDGIIEEKLDNNLGKIRKNIRTTLVMIEKMYQNSPGVIYHIENFQQTNKMGTMKQDAQKEKETQKLWEQFILVKWKRTNVQKNVFRIIEYYQSREFEQNPYKNVLMKLLTLDDHFKSYNKYLADGCINLVANLTGGNNGNNYDRCFFLNERYTSYFQSFNTLMSYSPNLRIQLYNLLQDARNETVGAVAHAVNFEGVRMDMAFLCSLWSTLVNLTTYIYFKPFHDKYGAEFIKKYLLVGNFLQNFFMNNFVKFKTFMNEKGYGILNLHALHLEEKSRQSRKHKHVTFEIKEEPHNESRDGSKDQSFASHYSQILDDEGNPLKKKKDPKWKRTADQTRESIFFENFLLMKEFFKKCNVSKNDDRRIVPSDREYLFPVLIQAMNNVTEFVSGPCLKNQLRIYDQYMFLWNGIIGRIVDDVDSSFYLVKGAVLLYIQGLLQGLNDKIVDFMSKQLEIQTLYETIIESIKLLYMKFKNIKKVNHDDETDMPELNDRQRMQNIRAKKYKDYDITNHFESLDRQNKLDHIVQSPDSMLELFKFNDKFNSHSVIQIVASSYVLMKILGDKIKFWYLYLEEKENMAEKWYTHKEGQEKHIIFNFLLKIMFSVEIVYEIIQNDEKAAQHKYVLNFGKKASYIEGKHMGSENIPKESVDRLLTALGKNKTSDIKPSNLALPSTMRLNSQGKMPLISNRSNALDQIDIKTRKLRVQRRFFYLRPPSCFFFTNYTKDQFLEGLPTEHITSKQLYLYRKIKHVQREVESHRAMITKYGIFALMVTGDAFKVYEIILVLLSFGLNILMMAVLENPSQTPGQTVTYNDIGDSAILIYAIIFIVISGIILVAWLIFRWRVEIVLAKEKKREFKPEGLSRSDMFRVRFVDSLILNSTFAAFLANFVVTILGLTLYYGIFTLNLFLVLKVFKPLTDIARALTDNAGKLFMTFILLLLMVYLTSFVILVVLSDRISHEVLGPQNCRDLITCFMNILNFAIRAPGGVGEVLALISDPKKQRFWTMWFLNMFFLFIIKLVVLDIVAGIIVETFGELRDERNEREHDELNFCMVCGMDRWESEKRLLQFEEHIQKTHSKWNYFYFLIRLLSLPKDELVGFEFDIINQFQRGHTRWFPHKNFLSEELGYVELKNEEEEKSDDEGEGSGNEERSGSESNHSHQD